MRIAVIIPTQFKRDTLDEALRSVREQTRRPDEIVIVNGNNQVKQMNQAVEMTTADAFLYLADDDTLEPTCIEMHERLMEEKGYDVVYSRFREFGERHDSHAVDWPPSTNLTKKDIWRKVGGFTDIGNAFDWEFALKLNEHHARIGSLGEVLWNYRVHPGQLSLDIPQMKESVERIKAIHHL